MIHGPERFMINQPTDRFPSCHCSSIVELSSGDLLCCWYAGSGEARPDVAILQSRLSLGAKEWGPFEVIADTPGLPEGNCVFFLAPDRTLWLFYCIMRGELEGPARPGVRWSTCTLHAKTSIDEGQTWSESRTLREKWGGVYRTKPIVLDNGDFILGLESEYPFSIMMISENQGKDWFFTSPLVGIPNSHPTLIQRSDGSLLALLRPGLAPWIARATSKDRGRTWSEAVNTDLPNPKAAVDMVQLRDRRVVLAFNNSPQHRNPLTLALSEDEGETWPWTRDLVAEEGAFSYPAIIEDREGLLHVTYTHKRLHIGHIVVYPEWIVRGGSPAFF